MYVLIYNIKIHLNSKLVIPRWNEKGTNLERDFGRSSVNVLNLIESNHECMIYTS